ncbi:MAG: glycosyltransferase family 2 protein [Thermoanaerobaculia bacterium]
MDRDAAPRPVDVSLLIVTWNSERWIERCLRSIDVAASGLTCEIVVCDNGSRDGTLERVRRILETAAADRLTHVIGLPDNQGFAAGINHAFRRSSGRFAFLLNPDCELQEASLTRLVEFLDSRPDVAAAAPLLHDDDGKVQREFQLRRLPTFGMLTAEILLVSKAFPGNRTTSRYRYRDLDVREPVRIEQPAAAALLVRRETMLQVGPLDERFSPAWFEDVDLCRRFVERAKPVFLVPSSHVTHSGGSSLETMQFGEFTGIWYRNMWRYAQKWMSSGETEALRWFMIGGMMLRIVAAIVGFRPEGVPLREALRAYAGVLKGAFERWDVSSPSSS